MPRPRLETERLVLQRFSRRDHTTVDDAIRHSLNDLHQWLPWARLDYEHGDTTAFIRDSLQAWKEDRAWDYSIRFKDEPDKHIGNVEDDRPDNDGYAVVGIGCPTPWMSDNGTPDDRSDDFPTGSYKMPECPSHLPGKYDPAHPDDNRMKCNFDESAI